MSNTEAPAKANERQKFRFEEYVVVIVAAVCSYLALLLAGVILAPTTEARLIAAVLVTAIFFFVGLLINFVYKPAYVPGVTLTPAWATRLLVWWGVASGGMRHIFRQPTFEDQIDAVIAVVASTVVIVLSLEFVFSLYDRKAKDTPKHLPAYLVSALGFAAALVFVPEVLRLTGTDARLARLLILIAGGLWAQVMWVLTKLCTATTEKKTIPEGHAGYVMAKKRIKTIEFEKDSVAIAKKDEEFETVDLRVRTSALTHTCESWDHAQVEVNVNVLWKVRKDHDSIRNFLTFSSQKPEEVFKEMTKAALTTVIGACRCKYLVGRYDDIAKAVKERLQEAKDKAADQAADKLGVEVERVVVTRLYIKYPSLADGAASHIEAERLRTLDAAVRTVSNRTLQHAERLSEIGANANTHANAERGDAK